MFNINMDAVYIITSPIRNNWHKVGYSTQGKVGLRDRYGTSLGYVNVRRYHEFRLYSGEERKLHQALNNYRIWSNREWFKCPYSIANYELAKLDGRYKAKKGVCKAWWSFRIWIVKAFTCKVKTNRVDYVD